MRVEQLMSRPVLTCGPNDPLTMAAQMMWDRDVGCVIVLRENKIVGVITDRDVCMGAYTSGQALWEIPVSRSMTAAPVTIHERATIDEAERLMREHHVRRLPVVNDSQALVGVLSLDDVAREARRQDGRGEGEISTVGVAETLGVVGESRKPRSLFPIKSR